MQQRSGEMLKAIEGHFHAVIRGRAAALVDRHRLTLPDLTNAPSRREERAWFPIPGMYGGFAYWLEGEGDSLKLISESWCRVVGGCAERHEITPQGSTLVAEGWDL